MNDDDSPIEAEQTDVESSPPPSEMTASTEPETALNSMELEVLQLREASNEFKNKYLLGLAEAENLRKRLQKERQELVQYAVQNIVADFLTPIDHFENALKFTDQASPDVKHWAVGFQMILTQFKDVLAANGISSFVSVGQPFDHACHDAIEMVETTEFAPGIVAEEIVRGYKTSDNRILRPARVKVAKAPPEEENIAASND